MTLPFKPMLSASLDDVDLSTLRYPLLASPKLDGVRCILWEGVAYSRNAKPIRNHFVQEWAKDFHNLDGELIVGSPTDPHCLANTQSGVMSYAGSPDFKFYLFDAPQGVEPQFHARLGHVQGEFDCWHRIECVPHLPITSAPDLLSYEQAVLDQGYEGVMLRSPNGPYKHGRATLREGYLMKLKRFTDGEAVVTALEEGHENRNDLTRDELGRAKRSKASADMVPNGMVGTIIVNDPKWGELRLSPGTMTHDERRTFWNYKSMLIGATVHWRSFGYGIKDKPRFPRFITMREDV